MLSQNMVKKKACLNHPPTQPRKHHSRNCLSECEPDARVSGGTVPITNKLLAVITAVGGGREPQAATTERLRSRKFNKRPPQWRRLQLAEPTGKAES